MSSVRMTGFDPAASGWSRREGASIPRLIPVPPFVFIMPIMSRQNPDLTRNRSAFSFRLIFHRQGRFDRDVPIEVVERCHYVVVPGDHRITEQIAGCLINTPGIPGDRTPCLLRHDKGDHSARSSRRLRHRSHLEPGRAREFTAPFTCGIIRLVSRTSHASPGSRDQVVLSITTASLGSHPPVPGSA